MFSIRQHCVPSYDFIRRVENVARLIGEIIPVQFQQFNEKTTEICNKAYAISQSEWYKSLPFAQNIQSGTVSNYMWYRDKEKEQLEQFLSAVKHLL